MISLGILFFYVELVFVYSVLIFFLIGKNVFSDIKHRKGDKSYEKGKKTRFKACTSPLHERIENNCDDIGLPS